MKIKAIFLAMVSFIGVTLFNQGLSVKPVLSIGIKRITPDSLIFKGQINNGRSISMEEFLMSGIPISMFARTELYSAEGKRLAEIKIRNQIKYDPIAKIFASISNQTDTLTSKDQASCWDHFFRMNRIPFSIAEFSKKEFTATTKVELQKVTVLPLDTVFNPMIFWQDKDLSASTSRIRIQFHKIRKS